MVIKLVKRWIHDTGIGYKNTILNWILYWTQEKIHY